MHKETFYFSHDYNARNDPKILELRSEYGMEGVGIYWCIIETLAEDENGYIIATLMGGLSVGLGVPKARLIEIIDFMVKIDLLCSDETGIYSRRMNEHKKVRKALSDNGKDGAAKRWGNRGPNGDPNAKERKEKESKLKDIINSENFKIDSTDIHIAVNEALLSEEEKEKRLNIIKKELLVSGAWHESVAMATGKQLTEIKKLIPDFIKILKSDSEYFKPLKDIKTHFRNWAKKQETGKAAPAVYSPKMETI